MNASAACEVKESRSAAPATSALLLVVVAVFVFGACNEEEPWLALSELYDAAPADEPPRDDAGPDAQTEGDPSTDGIHGCDGAGVDGCHDRQPVGCSVAKSFNACGGCGELQGNPGAECDEDSEWRCNDAGEVSCVRVRNTVCPVARATCTVQGSNSPGSTELLVLPLDTVLCTAEGSEGLDGEIVGYEWSVVEKPDGSVATIRFPHSPEAELFVDIAGPYVLNLEVVDSHGCVSRPAPVTVMARPDRDIHIELTWHTPADPDPTDTGLGLGADLDIHFLHPNGCWNDRQWDVHFRNKQPNWGDLSSRGDDPSIDIDNTDGSGPENMNLNNPERHADYTVGVHYYNDWGYGVSYATVRIFIFGVLVYEARDREMVSSGDWWVVAGISWPSVEVIPIDLKFEDVPNIGGACEF